MKHIDATEPNDITDGATQLLKDMNDTLTAEGQDLTWSDYQDLLDNMENNGVKTNTKYHFKPVVTRFKSNKKVDLLPDVVVNPFHISMEGLRK